MDNLIVLLVVSLITESVWETLKMTWQNGKFNIDKIGAVVVGLLVAFTTNVDLLALVGIQVSIPFIGVILTGILISRGANFIHDLYGKLSNPSEVAATIAENISDNIKDESKS